MYLCMYGAETNEMSRMWVNCGGEIGFHCHQVRKETTIQMQQVWSDVLYREGHEVILWTKAFIKEQGVN